MVQDRQTTIWIPFELGTWTYGSSLVCISLNAFVSELFVSVNFNNWVFDKDILFNQVV